MPADETDADDLFGDLDDEEPAIKAPADDSDDLFPADDAGDDDLFPADDEEAPADESDDDLDDLFGKKNRDVNRQNAAATVNKSDATQAVQVSETTTPFRSWIDNTGRYKTIGRLVNISETHVRLLKDNGRFSTVPKRRLSQNDLDYVERMAKKMGTEDFEKIAKR